MTSLGNCLRAAAIAWPWLLAAQPSAGRGLGENAALRYWMAFAQMRDATVNPAEARELQAILEGSAPYADLKYRDLVESNRQAVETMHRGTALDQCDWALEYSLGSAAPVEYVRKALALGRLNILLAMHRLQVNDRPGGLKAIAAGLRFSHHVAAGGPLATALSGKTLLISHLRAIEFAAVEKPLSREEKAVLLAALDRIGGEGVDWSAAVGREFGVLAQSGARAPAVVESLYPRAVADASQLAALEQAIRAAPASVAARIPNPRRVFDQRRELVERLREVRRKLAD